MVVSTVVGQESVKLDRLFCGPDFTSLPVRLLHTHKLHFLICDRPTIAGAPRVRLPMVYVLAGNKCPREVCR